MFTQMSNCVGRAGSFLLAHHSSSEVLRPMWPLFLPPGKLCDLLVENFKVCRHREGSCAHAEWYLLLLDQNVHTQEKPVFSLDSSSGEKAGKEDWAFWLLWLLSQLHVASLPRPPCSHTGLPHASVTTLRNGNRPGVLQWPQVCPAPQF